MHEIQQRVLTTLMNTDYARFRDLKVPDVDSNQFVYHLKRLLTEELIVKKGINYSLTSKGKEYVGRLSSLNYQVRIQPKIVTLIVAKDVKGRYLLYQRRLQPFIGKVGFPYGKIHLGETIAKAAQRELVEKCGLKAKLEHIGDAYVVSYEQDELISHMLFHVFLATEVTGKLIESSKYGTFFWEEVTSTNSTRFFPGFAEIFKAVQVKTKPFFLEVEHRH